MTLYQITEDIQALYDLVSELEVENREPTQEEDDFLRSVYENIKVDFENKVNGYCKAIKNVSADIEEIDTEIKRLKDRKSAKEKAVQRLKDLLQFGLSTIGSNKIDTGLFIVSVCNNPPALNINNHNKIPQEYLIPQEPKVNVSGIKQAIKDGADFDWCELVIGTSLRIK